METIKCVFFECDSANKRCRWGCFVFETLIIKIRTKNLRRCKEKNWAALCEVKWNLYRRTHDKYSSTYKWSKRKQIKSATSSFVLSKRLSYAKLYLLCTVVLLVAYSPRFEFNILIKMLSLQWYTPYSDRLYVFWQKTDPESSVAGINLQGYNGFLHNVKIEMESLVFFTALCFGTRI
jgi:hypothetical protein